MTNCSACGAVMQVKCGCGRQECALVTAVPICPICEPTRLAKWQTAHEVKVCSEYVKKQLGL